MFLEEQVLELWTDDSTVAGEVQGSEGEPYTTTISPGTTGWVSACDCPVGVDCKHVYALGLTWIAQCSGIHRAIEIADSRKPPVSPAPAAAPTGAANPAPAPVKRSFREIWAPRLAEKIGRPLSDHEARLLGQLSALFTDMRQAGGRISKGLWWQRGFAVSSAPNPLYERFDDMMPDWWPREAPPADPWALWQYVAYQWQLENRAIPEAFQPMTDTAPVRAYVGQKQLREELAHWRRGLGNLRLNETPATATAAPDSPLREELRKFSDLRLRVHPDASLHLEVRHPKPKAGREWVAPTQKWIKALLAAFPADTEGFPPPARRVALLLRLAFAGSYSYLERDGKVPADKASQLCLDAECHPAIFLPDGTPFRVEPEALVLTARPLPDDPDRLGLELSLPDGRPLTGWPPRFLPLADRTVYLVGERLHPGPPRPPAERMPVLALSDPAIMQRLPGLGLRLPKSLEARFRDVPMRPRLRVGLRESSYDPAPVLLLRLEAVAEDPPCVQEWRGREGWCWLRDATPPAPGPDDPHLRFDLAAVNAVGARFAELRVTRWDSEEAWTRPAGRAFPDDFLAWRDSLPPGVEVLLSPELRGLADDPYRAHQTIVASPAEGEGRDWFDVRVELKPEDLSLSAEEVRLLLAARGGWVRLPDRGWRRMRVEREAGAAEALEKLGLPPDLGAGGEDGPRERLRYHALQLAQAPLADPALSAGLRQRVENLGAEPPPPLPAGLRAELRPYQLDGYHFLAHLSRLGLGGVLADDMGLGKTLQTLAWLLHLARPAPGVADPGSETPDDGAGGDAPAAGGASALRVLIVCPKSVVPNWLQETARFAPGLATAVLARGERDASAALPAANLLVVNYTQLRLRADALRAERWDAVVLDEGQNIKNPASATARAACALRAAHRLVLSGTPVENRLLDLWSLLHFAQPGLLGGQTSFQRLYSEKTDPAGARARLAQRVRPFLLRRTKAQVAKDLPPRIEEEIVCELEGAQRTLYEAELKRARQMLLDVQTSGQFDAQRFNILQSLLRLRQICCDPRLLVAEGASPSAPASATATADVSVSASGADAAAASAASAESAASAAVAGTPKRKGGRPRKKAADAEAATEVASAASAAEIGPGAKIEALFDALEPLVAEGHRVLVFSQFTRMLELIRAELESRGIGHLLLTGQTENRRELVEKFQAPDGPPVFLLSLKAAGAGLNLTAASYVVLFDPWWNPAVEAQAIDRTHRIGQANTVIAYRLLAKDTVEEKIRALQKEKAALAAAVVQEESLSTVMDLESLRRILG